MTAINQEELRITVQKATEAAHSLLTEFRTLGLAAEAAEVDMTNLRYVWSAIQRQVGRVDGGLQMIEEALFPELVKPDELQIPEELPKAGDGDKMVIPPFDSDESLTDDLGSDTDDLTSDNDGLYDDGADEDLRRD
jgi:hypothetical protein